MKMWGKFEKDCTSLQYIVNFVLCSASQKTHLKWKSFGEKLKDFLVSIGTDEQAGKEDY